MRRKMSNIFGSKKRKEPENLIDYIKLCFPVLLFPILYFPYVTWWRGDFAELASRVIIGADLAFMRFMIVGNNTVLLFWTCVTALVMAVALVTALAKIRLWYALVIYLAVIFSLCGIFSLWFYTQAV